ncbi:hypothetical protein EJ110_NYTH40152 [Nymphaea thermarum]|nr:hypothetical protein EJ110_NYTH40152 [Nymphaea thermarum]
MARIFTGVHSQATTSVVQSTKASFYLISTSSLYLKTIQVLMFYMEITSVIKFELFDTFVKEINCGNMNYLRVLN